MKKVVKVLGVIFCTATPIVIWGSITYQVYLSGAYFREHGITTTFMDWALYVFLGFVGLIVVSLVLFLITYLITELWDAFFGNNYDITGRRV